MSLFLERKKPKVVGEGLPPKSQGTARKNVKREIRTLTRQGSDPLEEPFIVDCDSSEDRSKSGNGICPCITVSRGAGHWVTNRGRRLTKEEMMRLQGMDPTSFKVAVSENQLGRQLGNTMSVNVLERIFVSLLPAAKLVRRSEVKDRWANGQAVKKLAATRGRGFKYMSAKAKIAARKAAEKVTVEETPPRTLKRRTSATPPSSPSKRLRRN